MIFSSVAEIEQALNSKAVSLHAKIKARYQTVDENGNAKVLLLDTTPGRMIFSEIVPRNVKVDISLANRPID